MRVTLSMPSPPAGPVPARIILRTSCGCCCAMTWAIMPPSDDPMLGGEAVHDSGVPVVQDCGQVGEEDHRHPAARTELAVGELHAAGVDGLRRGGLPGCFQSRVRVC